MLVLNRQDGQAIKIGDTVTIRLLSIKKDSVQLGIDAPAETLVRKEEINENRMLEASIESGYNK